VSPSFTVYLIRDPDATSAWNPAGSGYVFQAVVLPEDTPRSGEPKPKGKTVALGLGTLALVFGAVAVGAMTSPGPLAEATTTTSASTTTSMEVPETPFDLENFAIDQIAVGDPLVWRETKTMVEGVPMGLASNDGWFYLFATPSATVNRAGSGGLRVWRSEDGRTWEYLGEGIPPGQNVIAIAGSARGLIAATAGEDGHELVLWQSNDGVTWEPEAVPIEDDPLARIGFASVTANEQTIIVSTYLDLAIDEMISNRMTQVHGADIAASHWGWGLDEAAGNPIFTLWGPFGFPLAEVSAEELELTEAEIEQVQRWSRGETSGSIVWTRDQAGVWTQVEIPDADWIDSIAVTQDGVFVANGGDLTGNTAWTSSDGITWEKWSHGVRPYRIITWGDRLIGPTSLNRASVMASPDGDTWSDIGPGDLFPSPLQWSISDVAAGPAGILGTVVGWGQESPVDLEPIPPPTVRDGGAVLTFDYDTSLLTLVAGADVYTWSMHAVEMPDGIGVDLATGNISFSVPETGELLAEFSFEEIQAAEQSYWSRGWSQNEVRALVFTPDGETWTIQDPVASFGDDHLVQDMEVGDSAAVVITFSVEGMFDPANSPGFSIWAAPIP
jgi:hypothetical protein